MPSELTKDAEAFRLGRGVVVRECKGQVAEKIFGSLGIRVVEAD